MQRRDLDALSGNDSATPFRRWKRCSGRGAARILSDQL
jgi:hypothetical protein